jgi:hypothetical protein
MVYENLNHLLKDRKIIKIIKIWEISLYKSYKIVNNNKIKIIFQFKN